MSCKFCPVVNVICFWGPQREAPWKRPVLVVPSAAMIAGAAAIAWFLRDKWTVAMLTASLVLFLFGVFGLGVAWRGCNACVARVCGSV